MKKHTNIGNEIHKGEKKYIVPMGAIILLLLLGCGLLIAHPYIMANLN